MSNTSEFYKAECLRIIEEICKQDKVAEMEKLLATVKEIFEMDDDYKGQLEIEELDWEDCYAFYNCDEISDFLGNHDALQHFKRHTVGDIEYRTSYYQTYGGGPEGGYFVKVAVHLPTGKETREVYSVDRNWGTPFTATLIHNKKLIYETGIEPSPRHAGKMPQVRLMDM